MQRSHPAVTATTLSFVLAIAPSVSRAQTVAQIAAQGACSTAGVEGLSNQLVDTQMCLMPGAFVPITPHANVTLTASRIHPFMVASARDALWSASDHHALQINSAFRTLADQYVLYHSGACGLAATPGNSNHETGRAVDLENWSAALSAMTAAGCTHPYPTDDPVHFDCPGGDMRAESIRAFQHVWNVNHPADMIDEDGVYGPITADRLGRSPADGFAMDGCPPAQPEWAAVFVAQSFPLASAEPLQMHPGESVSGWIELRNIGTHTWDANTRLGTTMPRDRSSALAGPDWIRPNRPAGATTAVAMGESHRFAFTLHAPMTTGVYDEHFGVVEEGVAWFSDSGQGGPPDNLLEVRVEVVPAIPGDSDASVDAAALDGSDRDAGFMTLADGARVPIRTDGCGCTVPRRDVNAPRFVVMFIAFVALASRRARKRRMTSADGTSTSNRWH
jgi:hypothetical protein